MSVRDYFVATVAVVIGFLSLASAFRVSAFGIQDRAYQLRSIRAIEQRWGDWAARVVLFVLAALMFTLGASIVASTRSVNGVKAGLPESPGQ